MSYSFFAICMHFYFVFDIMRSHLKWLSFPKFHSQCMPVAGLDEWWIDVCFGCVLGLRLERQDSFIQALQKFIYNYFISKCLIQINPFPHTKNIFHSFSPLDCVNLRNSVINNSSSSSAKHHNPPTPNTLTLELSITWNITIFNGCQVQNNYRRTAALQVASSINLSQVFDTLSSSQFKNIAHWFCKWF